MQTSRHSTGKPTNAWKKRLAGSSTPETDAGGGLYKWRGALEAMRGLGSKTWWKQWLEREVQLTRALAGSISKIVKGRRNWTFIYDIRMRRVCPPQALPFPQMSRPNGAEELY